jgi:CheY-like chemotaxis protein
MLKSINCLLVEDDYEDQQFFLEALHDLTDVADCYCAKNGKQALAIIREGFMPNVIFTDYNMPEMNGHEFLNIIKGDLQLRKIPVYVFTSLLSDALITSLRLSGADGVFHKSTVSKLRKTILHCIRQFNSQTIL